MAKAGKVFVIADGLKRANGLCMEHGIRPRSRDTYIITRPDAGRGCLFRRGVDRLVLDSRFSEMRGAGQIALALAPAGLDLFPFLKPENEAIGEAQADG